jgi:hypothetical protein
MLDSNLVLGTTSENKHMGSELGRPPAHEPVMAPRNLPGFPHARRVKPKTKFAGGRRARWRDANGDILEWVLATGGSNVTMTGVPILVSSTKKLGNN